MEEFQEWQSVTFNPETGPPFMRHNLSGDLVQFCVNRPIST